MQRIINDAAMARIHTFLSMCDKHPDELVKFGSLTGKVSIRASAKLICDTLLDIVSVTPVENEDLTAAEYQFLENLDGQHMVNLAGLAWTQVEVALNSILYNIFKLKTPGNTMPGRNICRMAKIVFNRRHTIGLNEENDFEEVGIPIEMFKKRKN